jgi:hypothetical protein
MLKGAVKKTASRCNTVSATRKTIITNGCGFLLKHLLDGGLFPNHHVNSHEWSDIR